jgi:hypothetical protein
VLSAAVAAASVVKPSSSTVARQTTTRKNDSTDWKQPLRNNDPPPTRTTRATSRFINEIFKKPPTLPAVREASKDDDVDDDTDETPAAVADTITPSSVVSAGNCIDMLLMKFIRGMYGFFYISYVESRRGRTLSSPITLSCHTSVVQKWAYVSL